MSLSVFYLKAAVYILCFILSYYGMNAFNFEKILKAGHVSQARVLYVLIMLALAWLSAQFILGFLYLG